METIDKLRRGVFYLDEDEFATYDGSELANNLADEIEQEIDKLYLAKPLFNDDVPMQFGDIFWSTIHKSAQVLNSVTIDKDGNYSLNANMYSCNLFLNEGKRAQRCDSQELLDKELELDPVIYCERYELEYKDPAKTMLSHLLKRQRDISSQERR